MTLTVSDPPAENVAGTARAVRITAGQLPRWAPWALLGLSLAASAAVFAVVAIGGGDFSLTGMLVVGALLYILLIAVISGLVEGRRKATDRVVTAVVTGAFALAMVPLISVSYTVLANGVAGLTAEFFSSSMRNVVGEGGGALHAIMGTVLITLAAAAISIPVGLLTAIYLVEYGRGALARGITFLVDVMTGIPSIVAGLFIYAVFALFMAPGVRLGLMGALALAVLMVPVVVRSSEEMLRLVPNELREASYALGVPKWLTILRIVLPTSMAGIVTGVMLAIARVIGETAPLLITAGFTASMNYNLADGRMMTLPVFVYTQYMNQGIPAEAYVSRAWAAALVLILIVMALNLIARLIAKFFAPATRR